MLRIDQCWTGGSCLNRLLHEFAVGRFGSFFDLSHVLGVRGGVGNTTIAVNTCWFLSERHQRGVLLLDLICRASHNHLEVSSFQDFWSGRRDLNPRPLVPQTSALTGLRHAPTENGADYRDVPARVKQGNHA